MLEADGWLHTGDTGYRDEEGFFYFVDRRCNMIKRGGENVSCVELENIIATHPKKFRTSWLWVLKIRFAMKPSKHLWC
ncbi:hypothetical protein ACP0HM_29110 [Escherichia coli]